MSSKKSQGSEAEKDTPKTADSPDAPTFRYSLELVASIAAHFAAGETDDRAATERALRLLDEVSKTIERKTILLRARNKAERLSETMPKRLEFVAGIRWITGKKTETDATKAFRAYLRLNLRLSGLGNPPNLTEDMMTALFEPLADGAAKSEEDNQIEKLIGKYRKEGFNQVQLGTIKEQLDSYQTGMVRPYRAVMNGRKGGRPRVDENTSKKSLVRKPSGKK